MAMITVHWLALAARAAIEKASSSDGIESMTSTIAHDDRVDPPAEGAAGDAEGEPPDEAEERWP